MRVASPVATSTRHSEGRLLRLDLPRSDGEKAINFESMMAWWVLVGVNERVFLCNRFRIHAACEWQLKWQVATHSKFEIARLYNCSVRMYEMRLYR